MIRNNYRIIGRQIFDSRGFPTIEIDILKNNLLIGRGSSPSGASTGSREAVEIRDNYSKYCGKSVFKTLEKIPEIEEHLKLNNSILTNLKLLDKRIQELDNTNNKSHLGGNLTTALSFALADAGANYLQIPLYQYLGNIYNNTDFKTPTPLVNILNGGKHAGGNLKIQEFMIMPNENMLFDKKMQLIMEVYHSLKNVLKNEYGPSAINLGDEGGFAPQLNSPDEAIDMIIKAINNTEYKIGEDINIALDCAASEFYKDGKYEIVNGNFLTSEELVQYYVNLCKKYPFIKSIEDPFDENDLSAWRELTRQIGHNTMIVGDDLFTTNPTIIDKFKHMNLANSLLLKVNQIGTISEAIEAAKIIQNNNGKIIVSHRSGETTNSLISDLACGLGFDYIKTGAPARGERVVKYNRLIQINQKL